MVVIRLARDGRRNRPFHHVTVADKRMARDSRFESIGYSNPLASPNEKALEIDTQRYQYWVSKGAQVSKPVQKLFKAWLKTQVVKKSSGLQ